MDKAASPTTAPQITEEQVDDALGQLAMQRLAEDDGERIPVEEIFAEFAPELLDKDSE